MQAIFVGKKESEPSIKIQELVSGNEKYFQCTFTENLEDVPEIIFKNKIDMLIIHVTNDLQEEEILHVINRSKKLADNLKVIGIGKTKDAYSAFKLKIKDYISVEESKDEFDMFFYEFFKSTNEHKVFIRTIPEFDVIIDDKQMEFTCKKGRELLALLVAFRGCPITNDAIISYMWEDCNIDKNAKNCLRVTYHKLLTELNKYGIGYILRDGNGKLRSINPDTFECDLYELFEGNWKYICQYNDRCLEQYSWSDTIGLKGNIRSYLNNRNLPIPEEE